LLSLVGEPRLQPLRRGDGEGVLGGLPHASRCPGMDLSGYPWSSALCALRPKKWCFPDSRAVYLRGGTNLMPAPRWRTWAFLLDSCPLPQPGPTEPPLVFGPYGPPTAAGDAPGPRPGCTNHDSTQKRGHSAPSQAREVVQEAGCAAVRLQDWDHAPPYLPWSRPSRGFSARRRHDRQRPIPKPALHLPPRTAVGVPDAGGAPVARTPEVDPGDEGSAEDASGTPSPVEVSPQGLTARATPRDHSEGPMETDPAPL